MNSEDRPTRGSTPQLHMQITYHGAIMGRPAPKITATLANGAEYLAMGVISADTGLLVSQAPRNNANFNVIVTVAIYNAV